MNILDPLTDVILDQTKDYETADYTSNFNKKSNFDISSKLKDA